MEINETIFKLIKEHKFDKAIEIITNEKIDVNIQDKNNIYMIQYAIIFNNIELIKILIVNNCKLDFIDSEGYSILYIPIKFGYNEIIDILIKNIDIVGIPIIDIIDKYGNTALHYCILYNNIDAFIKIIDITTTENVLNNKGYSILHYAIKKKLIKIVNILLNNANVDINLTTSIGESALHIACNYESTEIIKMLLTSNKQINIDMQDYEHHITPLMYLISLHNIKLIKLLLSYNADIHKQNIYGNTALHLAIIEDNIEIVNVLIPYYTEYNLINIDGMTVLHLLFEHINSNLPKGSVPLGASQILTKYTIDNLIEKTNLNLQSTNGNTLLYLIIQSDIFLCYKHLFKHKKLNIFIKNEKGETPYDVIKKENYEEIINIVIESYYNILKNNKYEYINEWEHECVKNILSKKECYEKIRNNIINNKISIPLNKRVYCSIEVNKNVVSYTTFLGVSIDIISGLLLLHETNLIMSTLNTMNLITNSNLNKYYQQIGIQKNNLDFLNFEIIWLYQILFLPTDFECIFTSFLNSEKNFFIIPIGIELDTNSHSNILIYDKNKNTLERFEPYGFDMPPNFNYNAQLLDITIQQTFNKLCPAKHMTYITPNMFLPKIGFQSYENIDYLKTKKIGDPGGFCSVWCLWYVKQRLLNVELSPAELVKVLITNIKFNNYSFKHIIRNYSKNITDYRDNLLSVINIDINDFINNQYDINKINALQSHIYSKAI